MSLNQSRPLGNKHILSLLDGVSPEEEKPARKRPPRRLRKARRLKKGLQLPSRPKLLVQQVSGFGLKQDFKRVVITFISKRAGYRTIRLVVLYA